MQNKQKVRKAVITAAGLGTRFLPVTKAMPKEMLPVLDKPVIQYIVEEMVASGIREIILVVNQQKRAILDHFKRDSALEKFLKNKGSYEKISSLAELLKKIKFTYVFQGKPLGNGHALLCAKQAVGNEPFAFSDGDSIIDSKIPVVKQILDVFYKKQAPVIGVQAIADKHLMARYGNVYGTPLKEEKKLYLIEKFVEKPAVDKVSPHGLIIGGMRYIFTKDIWPLLEQTRRGRGGEIWVADAASELARQKPFYAYEYEGKYFDTGDKLALLKTAIHFAMKEEDTKKEILKIL